MNETLSILVSYGHDLFGDAISFALSGVAGFEVTIAFDINDTIEKLKSSGIDIVLLDLAMPGMDGLDSVRKIVEAVAPGRVLMISTGETPEFLARAIEFGSGGFVTKNISLRALPSIISLVAAGEIFLPTSHQMQETEIKRFVGLSNSESAVLSSLGKGQSNKQIGKDLGLSEFTVKMHMRNVCKKLNAKNRTEAAMIAQEAHLVGPDRDRARDEIFESLA